MTWYELTLHHGPKLIHQRPDRDDPALDVTDRTCEFLFAQIRLADDVTLLDILRLLDNPVMRTVFRREYVNELLTEATLGPLNKDKLPYEKVEYIELNQLWHLDSAKSEFTSAGKFGVSGKGIVQQDEVVEHDIVLYKKGERINWSVSMTSVRELMHLPVRLNSTVQICENDVYAKRYGDSLQIGVNHQISLGTLIQSLLWELSWHGTPEQRDVRKNDLLASKAEVDTGTAKTRPYENLFEARGDLPKSKVYPMFFDEVDASPLKAIERAINDLEDTELAQSGLDQAFGGTLVLKREFATFTGRQLRVAVSEARSPTTSRPFTQYDPDAEYAKEISAWDNMVPVGREFGSPDFERLMDEDRVEFQEKLLNLVHECKSIETAKNEINPASEWYSDAINVQLALKELGQEVSVGLAAAVWVHYSSSLAASWMTGADTVRSAQRMLSVYVTKQPYR